MSLSYLTLLKIYARNICFFTISHNQGDAQGFISEVMTSCLHFHFREFLPSVSHSLCMLWKGASKGQIDAWRTLIAMSPVPGKLRFFPFSRAALSPPPPSSSRSAPIVSISPNEVRPEVEWSDEWVRITYCYICVCACYRIRSCTYRYGRDKCSCRFCPTIDHV